MARPFIEQFIEFNKDAESPESFFRWAAYATVAATLRDSVYLDLGVQTVWPNIYVILMARSAAMRKSVPVSRASSLLLDTNHTKVITGRSSIQAVIRELGYTETDGKTGAVKTSACGIILSSELAAFAPEDPATIPILTEIYDNHPVWNSSLVGAGKTVLKNTCISLLAASNEPLFKQVYTSTALRGGLLGRTFIVREIQKSKINSLMYIQYTDEEMWQKEMQKKHDTKELKEALIQIGSLKGRATMDFDARVEYDKWYNEFQLNLASVSDDSGVADRIHAGVLKIALIMAVAETYELRVKLRHIEESIDRCIKLLKSYEVLLMGSGKSQTAEGASILLAYLWERGGKEKHRVILRSNWQHFDAKVLDEVILPTLTQAGLVHTISVDGEPGLGLTQKGREIFESRLT